MLNAEYERAYLQAALEALEKALLSNTLYWSLNLQAPRHMPPYPSLTPGNILLALRRLQAVGAEDDFPRRLEAARAPWLTHWRRKAEQEARARLRQWENFLTEKGDKAPYYHYKVRERVILALLAEDLGALPAPVTGRLTALDEMLRSVFRPGAFLWEAALQRVFPREGYWFLYGTIVDQDAP